MKEHKAFGLLLLIPALYGLLAVGSFLLHFSPTAHETRLLAVVLTAFIVTLPYALLYLACRIATDSTSYLWIGILLIPVVLLAVFFYWGSFAPNDGEYALVYLIAPALQAPFVLLALLISFWRRMRSAKKTLFV